MKRSVWFSRRYFAAMDVALFQQALLVVTAYAFMGSTSVQRCVAVAIAAHWLALLLLMLVRPRRPTGVDLLICRWGTLPFFGLAVAFTPLVLRHMARPKVYKPWPGEPVVAEGNAWLLPAAYVAGVWCVLYVSFLALRGVRRYRAHRTSAPQSLPEGAAPAA